METPPGTNLTQRNAFAVWYLDGTSEKEREGKRTRQTTAGQSHLCVAFCHASLPNQSTPAAHVGRIDCTNIHGLFSRTMVKVSQCRATSLIVY
jgi:hypothetical protein